MTCAPPSLEKSIHPILSGVPPEACDRTGYSVPPRTRRDPENILDIIRFDAMDIFTETNEVEYSLTNSLLARKDVPDNSPDTPQARGISFSGAFRQKYYFDPTFGGACTRRDPTYVRLHHRPYRIRLRIRAAGFTDRFRVQVRPLLKLRYGNPHRPYPSGAGGVLDAGVGSHVKRGLAGGLLQRVFINHSLLPGDSLSRPTTAGLPPTSLPPLTAFNRARHGGDLPRDPHPPRVERWHSRWITTFSGRKIQHVGEPSSVIQ